jgi:hypothetical protein
VALYKGVQVMKWESRRTRSIVFGECSSLEDCPLEEASEYERIPSIIESIVWCFPTLRVFIIIKWEFFHIVSE